MNRTRLPLIFCALLATGACTVAQAADDSKDLDSPDTVIATVNGKTYPLDTFRLFYAERLRQTPNADPNSQELQQRVFDEFMNLIVASQEAEKRKLEGERDVVAALQLERMKVLSTAALGAMAEEVKPTDDQIQDAYKEFAKQAAHTEYKARHILVKDKKEAEDIIRKLDKGGDFAELAKKYSLGPTGKNGGELDWFDASKMVAPFAEAVAKMKKGTYTKEPVQTQFGWHVIQLEDVRQAEPPSFEDAKPQLTAILKRRAVAQKLAEMRNATKVDLNEDIVKIQKKDE